VFAALPHRDDARPRDASAAGRHADLLGAAAALTSLAALTNRLDPPLRASESVPTSPASASSLESMRPAMKAASSCTNPMSADPRVCCQVSPMKNRPGASVTPRRWMMPPLSSLTPGTSIQEKSGRYPVAQTIASISCSLPSSKRARRPLALVSRFRKVTPECRRPLGLDPMSTSRFANFRPKR
jgi:hypothetical protein